MFSVTYAQLNTWMAAFLWPLVRILALVATGPVFGNAALSTRVKIGLASFITLIVAPTLGPMPQVTVFSAMGVWIIVNQFLIGAALGLTMQIGITAIQATGEFAGLGMGLGFATFFDQQTRGSTAVLSSYMNVFAMLVFLVLDGHLQMLSALIATFQSLPISSDLLGAAGWRAVPMFGGTIFSMGLLLALPVVAALLIANLALGILNRAAPQIGVFQIGFPLTMLVGMLLLQLMVPNMIPFFARLFDDGIEQMGRVAAALH
ncbi:flagellar biosynthetic protein FliR [Paraburkholderia sp. GAS41]|jgi:flagellar biosynthetic protein FliR|uniref:flagellar biosynthetic protein FliR n=1 Tax=Paraburkholderia sp. GAS41 TaxID=3035134 RepID=UPI003D1AF5EE